MDQGRVREYLESLSDTTIRFSPYAVLKTGLLTGQTVLNLEDYTLICSPYKISMRKAILLLILSGEEIKFFRERQQEQCSINIAFQKSDSDQPSIFNVKGKIDSMESVKNKQNLCRIDLSFLHHPPKLIEILGDYILNYTTLKGYYDTFQGRDIPMDKNMSRMLKFNNYMECFIGDNKVNAELVTISVSRLVFDIPADTPEIRTGSEFSCKLYFQLYRFTVNAKVDELEDREQIIRIHASINFTPELIEIMDDYFYRLTHSSDN